MALVSLGNFYGIDSVIDLLIGITSLLVFFQGRRIYNVTRDKTFNFFSISFLMIGIGFFFKTLSNITSLYEVTVSNSAFLIHLLHELSEIGSLGAVHFFSFVFFKTFLICGFFALFLIFGRTKNVGEAIAFFYLGVMVVLFSIYYNFIFHLSLVVILALICIYFFNNYRRQGYSRSLKILIAFALVLLSNFVSLFNHMSLVIYLASEIIIFFGFMIILFVHLGLKNGKKKIKARNYKRST